MGKTGEQLERLVGIMARLRAEGGCPWDRAQDLRSLRPYLVEEAFEVLDEMDRVAYGGPWRDLCGELGDLLFQIVFHAQLAGELSEFAMADVCQAISDKIESRHPHVFGEAALSREAKGLQADPRSPDQVLDNWAKLKAAEKKRKTGSEGSVLDGVPSAAPALLRAERLTEKASRIGFDWPDIAGVRDKLDEELGELDAAIALRDRDALEHELGDVLFSLCNLARFLNTPPEDALRQANRRFTSRFHQIEAGLRAEGVAFGQATLEQMDALWKKAKETEAQLPPPRALPRAPLARLELPVADPAAQRAFWDRLAPAIGWRSAPREPLTYTDGALALAFVPAPAASPALGGLAMALEAPSRSAVAALRKELEAWGGAQALGDAKDAVTFTDPAGLRWRYAVAWATATPG